MKKRKAQGSLLIGLGVVCVVVLSFLAAGFDSVDASHKGVKNKMGKIIGTQEPGYEWTGLFVQVYQYSLKTRKTQIVMEGANGAVDKDGQSVFATIEINYRINPASVEDAYKNVGTDNELANILNIDGIIREGFKSITSEYTSLEIFQKRAEVKQRAIEKVKENFPNKYFTLENVIISNIDFNPAFKAAIESKKVAEETAKAETEKVKIAQAQAEIKIAQAEGEKQKVQLEADAEAYRILKQAESEAKSLEMKRQQLTPMMVQNNWIDQWDGKLPTYMMGEGNNMLFQMPLSSGNNNVISDVVSYPEQVQEDD